MKHELGDLSPERRAQVLRDFKGGEGPALPALTSYADYLKLYGFSPPKHWEEFADKWQMPPQEVANIFRRLQESEVKVVMERFFHNNSSQQSTLNLLRSYVRSCQAKGFWQPNS